MNQKETIALARVLINLERFTYADSTPVVINGRETSVADLARERTRLWRETWITPPLRAVVERYAKKHGVNLDAEDLKRGGGQR